MKGIRFILQSSSFILSATVILFATALVAADQWQPATAPLMTRWAKDVSPRNVHPEYPRPQMVRKEWQNLNGLWDYAITAKDAPQPVKWDGQILVPFPIESALSGVMKRVYETNRLWYRRTFTIPRGWKGRNVLLNFGAVDWETTVLVNGKKIGSHRGGFDGFTFDITDALKPKGEQEIVVSVFDPTDAGTQPRGKQVRHPRGIWYTPTSGIWQTVWLEPVEELHIQSLRITPDMDKSIVNVACVLANPRGLFPPEIEFTVLDGNQTVARQRASRTIATDENSDRTIVEGEADLKIQDVKKWSPDSPFLYNLQVLVIPAYHKHTLLERAVGSDPTPVDELKCYFAMRKISLGKDEHGHLRLCLNNQPCFMLGMLDQGFWPDGLYTAPTDAALRYDIEMTKKLGFNLARKHVKVEPERWYYWCDKLGLLVWQDMPNGDKHIKPADPDLTRSPESAQQFELELKALIAGRFNHPSIVMWVPYNEGWGQWNTCHIVDLIKQWDSTRLVNHASGWVDRGCGDVNDLHYPKLGVSPVEDKRATVFGEFGGEELPIQDWKDAKNRGHRSNTNSEVWTTTYLKQLDNLRPLAETNGLSAVVYTQTTDVEIEMNGLMTYDRALLKMDEAIITKANKSLYDAASRDTAKPGK